MGIVRRRKVDVAADIPARRIADLPVELDDAVAARSATPSASSRAVWWSATIARSPPARRRRRSTGIDHELVRRVADPGAQGREREKTGENVFSMMRRIGPAKAGLAADYAAQLARNAGKVVFFAKHIDVMDAAEAALASAASATPPSVATRRRGPAAQHRRVRQRPRGRRRRLLADRGRGGHQPAGRVQRRPRRALLDRRRADPGHRPGPPDRPDQPVTAWRIIAAQTIDTRIAELIDTKAGAGRASARRRRRGGRRLGRRPARGARRAAHRCLGGAAAGGPIRTAGAVRSQGRSARQRGAGTGSAVVSGSTQRSSTRVASSRSVPPRWSRVLRISRRSVSSGGVSAAASRSSRSTSRSSPSSVPSAVRASTTPSV